MLGHVTLFVFLLPRIEIVMRNRKLNWCGLSKLFIDEFKAANDLKLQNAIKHIREQKVRLRIKKSNETHWDSNQQPLAS